MIVNYHIYPTTMTNESRMMKETTSIVRLGLAHRVFMVGIKARGLASSQSVDEKRTIIRLSSFFSNAGGKAGRMLFYLEIYVRYFFFLLTKKVHILNCHSLMMLPVAVAIKKLKGCRLIYDTHELESERTGLVGAEQKISKWIERRLISSCDSVITVGPEISRWYRETYNLAQVFTVRNIPSIKLPPSGRTSILRDQYGLSSDQLLFIYQGYFIRGRGIEILLAAFAKLPPMYHIVFMGEGMLSEEIVAASRVHKNIHLQETVPYAKILEYTSGCDIGVSLFENTCLSHYYVLPNKLFEYLKSHLPVLVSDFPEMRNIVQTYDCGWLTDPTVESVIASVTRITVEETEKFRKNAIAAAATLSWDNEEVELVHAFGNKILSK